MNKKEKNLSLKRIAGFIFSGAMIISGGAARADDHEVRIEKVVDLGVSPQDVIDAFQNQHGVLLNPDSVVKVSPDEEGNTIQFETLDHLAVVVSHSVAGGGFKARGLGHLVQSEPLPEKQLNYVLVSPRAPIVLNLFEAERYESAVVVQPLIGNLVYYSNKGRYEPKLARNWIRVNPFTWRFTLREGFFCENGEAITAKSFRKSILRSLKTMSKNSDFPVFSRLSGYSEFKAGGDLRGLQSSGSELIFSFDQPIRSGLLQLLSFAPFGYICGDNLNPDGSWKDDHKFVSSGPYRVESMEVGKAYVLVRNPKWGGVYQPSAPTKIRFTHDVPHRVEKDSHWVIDSFSPVAPLPGEFLDYRLVPEYINPILLGNLKSGYFSHPENRKRFRVLLEKYRGQLPERWDGHTRSVTFYPNQAPRSPERVSLPLKLRNLTERSGLVGQSLREITRRPKPGGCSRPRWKRPD